MKTKKGIVTSAKMTNTVTVTVHRFVFHPIYKKRFRRSKKFHADCKGIEDLMEGDTVLISECSPISKLKRFRVSDVVERIPRVSDIKDEEGIDTAIHGEKDTKKDKKELDTDVQMKPKSKQNIEQATKSNSQLDSNLQDESISDKTKS